MSKLRNQHLSIKWNDLIDFDSSLPASQAPLCEKSALVGRTGLLFLSVGAPAFRVRAAMNKLSRALGITCNADIGLLTIEYTCVAQKESFSNAVSISTTGVNIEKFVQLRKFTDSFEEAAASFPMSHFFQKLEEIEKLKGQYDDLRLSFAAAMACAAFTFLLDGGIPGIICAFFGAGFGNFLRRKLLKHHITLFANVALSVVTACSIYIVFLRIIEIYFYIAHIHHSGYICSMLFVIPGFPLITGGLDLAKLDLRSGFERILFAILVIFVATITGWLCAFVYGFQPEIIRAGHWSPAELLIFRLIASFLGVYGFSLMFNSSVKIALSAGLIGMISNTIRLFLIDFKILPFPLAAFLCALFAGLSATAVKKIIGYPRITITVPSVVIMVPGLFMYRCVYYFAQENIVEGSVWLTKAILIVCSLCLGLITARIITDKNFRTHS